MKCRLPSSQIVHAQPIALGSSLISGPPRYLTNFMKKHRRQKAWKHGLRLAHGMETLILDHHLLRCEADFMEQSRHLLEARSVQLYEEMPIPEDWHEAYVREDADTKQYRNYAD